VRDGGCDQGVYVLDSTEPIRRERRRYRSVAGKAASSTIYRREQLIVN